MEKRESIQKKIGIKKKNEISDTLHIAVPEFYYIPKGMEYDNIIILDATQMAIIRYQYNGHICIFSFSGK